MEEEGAVATVAQTLTARWSLPEGNGGGRGGCDCSPDPDSTVVMGDQKSGNYSVGGNYVCVRACMCS